MDSRSRPPPLVFLTKFLPEDHNNSVLISGRTRGQMRRVLLPPEANTIFSFVSIRTPFRLVFFVFSSTYFPLFSNKFHTLLPSREFPNRWFCRHWKTEEHSSRLQSVTSMLNSVLSVISGSIAQSLANSRSHKNWTPRKPFRNQFPCIFILVCFHLLPPNQINCVTWSSLLNNTAGLHHLWSHYGRFHFCLPVRLEIQCISVFLYPFS